MPGTAFWYALGPDARMQLDVYLHRYLRPLGEGPTESDGADEVLLVSTTRHPEDVERLTDPAFGRFPSELRRALASSNEKLD